MRIEGSAYVVQLSRPQAARGEKAAAAGVQGAAQPARVRSLDRVEISPKARELQKLKQELAALPDVRLDRVALARQSLQSGGQVAPSIVAQNMMESFDSQHFKGDGP
jgi:negative regulator of flagellin synthesis FlgM